MGEAFEFSANAAGAIADRDKMHGNTARLSLRRIRAFHSDQIIQSPTEIRGKHLKGGMIPLDLVAYCEEREMSPTNMLSCGRPAE